MIEAIVRDLVICVVLTILRALVPRLHRWPNTYPILTDGVAYVAAMISQPDNSLRPPFGRIGTAGSSFAGSLRRVQAEAFGGVRVRRQESLRGVCA